MATWKHVRAVLLLPCMVTVVIPCALLYHFGMDTLGLWRAAPLTRLLLPAIGLLLVLVGLTLLVATIRLFAAVGKGTLAPWDPTQTLVVEGVYRHVRNPMISGVCLILLGESIGFASLPILGWAIIFILANAIYMPLFEEPSLAKRFGDEYLEYRRNVPRWRPMLRPWKPK